MQLTAFTARLDRPRAGTAEETGRLRGDWLAAEQLLDDAMPQASAWAAMTELRARSSRGRLVARRSPTRG